MGRWALKGEQVDAAETGKAHANEHTESLKKLTPELHRVRIKNAAAAG